MHSSAVCRTNTNARTMLLGLISMVRGCEFSLQQIFVQTQIFISVFCRQIFKREFSCIDNFFADEFSLSNFSAKANFQTQIFTEEFSMSKFSLEPNIQVQFSPENFRRGCNFSLRIFPARRRIFRWKI